MDFAIGKQALGNGGLNNLARARCHWRFPLLTVTDCKQTNDLDCPDRQSDWGETDDYQRAKKLLHKSGNNATLTPTATNSTRLSATTLAAKTFDGLARAMASAAAPVRMRERP